MKLPNAVVFNNIRGSLEYFSRFQPTPLSMRSLMDFGQCACEVKAFIYLRKELPVRMSAIMNEIRFLPEDLLRTPSSKLLNEWYSLSFTELLSFGNVDPNDNETLEKFCDKLTMIHNRHLDVVPTMANAVLELKSACNVDRHLEDCIHYFLDRLFLSRISVNTLVHHHTQLFGKAAESVPINFIGSIDPECNLVDLINHAFEDAQFLCERDYLAAPELVITQHNVLTDEEEICVACVPSNLHYVLCEIFKNALRAVVEYHESSGIFPPVEVMIVKSTTDITIKISDQGGGMSRDELGQIFDYMYSTAAKPMDVVANNEPLAGYGYGLPLSRLYARYLQGDVTVQTCEGYGTDAIVYLKVDPKEATELLPIFNKTCCRFYNARIASGDWSRQESIMGEHHVLRSEKHGSQPAKKD